MAIYGVPHMPEQDREYSVAEAKGRLPALIHQVETDGAIHITRRGQPAAVLISEAEYARLRNASVRTPLGPAVRAWRARTEGRAESGELRPEDLRDRSPGRDVDFG